MNVETQYKIIEKSCKTLDLIAKHLPVIGTGYDIVSELIKPEIKQYCANKTNVSDYFTLLISDKIKSKYNLDFQYQLYKNKLISLLELNRCNLLTDYRMEMPLLVENDFDPEKIAVSFHVEDETLKKIVEYTFSIVIFKLFEKNENLRLILAQVMINTKNTVKYGELINALDCRLTALEELVGKETQYHKCKCTVCNNEMTSDICDFCNYNRAMTLDYRISLVKLTQDDIQKYKCTIESYRKKIVIPPKNEKEETRDELRKGDLVVLGKYYSINNADKTNLEWKILSIDQNIALLITNQIINCIPFDSVANEWEKSAIKGWLNDEFYYESELDKNKLLPFEDGSHISLLDIDQVNQYMKTNNSKRAEGSEYAKKVNHGQLSVWDKYSPWFLKNKKSIKNVSGISDTGNITSFSANASFVGIRPVCMADLSMLKKL